MTDKQQDPRDEAFAAALNELYKKYPVWEGAHESAHSIRSSVHRKALMGGYRDKPVAYSKGIPHWPDTYWQNILAELAAEDLRIPPDELLTIYSLIY